jgi:hypothetical protein
MIVKKNKKTKQIGLLSISRRESSYESDLELRYSLFPVQWDRNDSICFYTFKKPEIKMTLPTIYIYFGIRKTYAIVSIPLNWK